MQRRRRRLLGGTAAVVLLAPAVGLVYARPLLLTGTGYAAHNACAVSFVADRAAASAEDDLPDNPLVPYLRTTVSTETSTATTSILGALFRQTARYEEGQGCTLRAGFASSSAGADRPSAGGGSAAGGLAIAPTTDPAIRAAVDAAFAGGAAARGSFTVPGAALFADGFESGDAGAWSLVLP